MDELKAATHEPGCCVDKRDGSPRGCQPETCMTLPDGATCSNCVHFPRCRAFGYTSGEAETTCSFFPRRFQAVLSLDQLAELGAAALAELRAKALVDAARGPLGANVELEILAANWAKAGAALFRGPALPTRAEVINAAQRVVLLSMLESGLSITAAAKRHKTSRRAMRSSMKRLGVYKPWFPQFDWDAETDLGKVSDEELAKRLGCSRLTVASARKRRGIPPCRRPALPEVDHG